MDVKFFRCNRCFLELTAANDPFSITQCGHLFCYKCVTEVEAKKTCSRCKTKNIMWITLSNPLQPELMPYFQSLEAAQNQLQKVISFKMTQATIASEFTSNYTQKYNLMKKEYWSLIQKYEHLKKKFKLMEQELQQRDQELAETRRRQQQVFSPVCPEPRNSILRGSFSSAKTPASILRRQLNNVQFSPNDRNGSPNTLNDSVFRVPPVPKSRGRYSGGSTGSQIRSPFSNYSSASDGGSSKGRPRNYS